MKIIRNGNSFQMMENNAIIGEITWENETNEYLIIDHTYVDEQYNGRGYARELVDKVVAYATAKNLKIIPMCPYVKTLFERHAETYGKIEYKMKKN